MLLSISDFTNTSERAVMLKYNPKLSSNSFQEQTGKYFCIHHVALIGVSSKDVAEYLCRATSARVHDQAPTLSTQHGNIPSECSCTGGFIDLLFYSNSATDVNDNTSYSISWTSALRFGGMKQFIQLTC